MVAGLMLHAIAGRHDMSWQELTKEGVGGIGEPAISLIMRRWPHIWQQNEQLALATHLTVFSLPQSNLHSHANIRAGYPFSKVWVCVRVAGVEGVSKSSESSKSVRSFGS